MVFHTALVCLISTYKGYVLAYRGADIQAAVTTENKMKEKPFVKL